VPSLLACCLAGLLLATSAEPRHAVIGFSAEDRSIDAYALRKGPHALMILGGIHGGTETNTAWLVWELLAYFEAQPEAVPESVTLWFIPAVNPDGISNGTRGLANGVDPNRNWPTADWAADTFAPGAILRYGGGGTEPLSEPETTALAVFIEYVQPVAIVTYHSAAGVAMGGPIASESGLLQAYLDAAAYAAHDWVAYPVTGDFAQWAEAHGIPTIEVELTEPCRPRGRSEPGRRAGRA
jgi:protein MpaA